MDIINAAGLFAGILAVVIILLIFAGASWLWFFYFSPEDKPHKHQRKRVRSLFRAKGPAHTTIIDPHPEAHGDVVRAVYPERVA